MQVKVTKWIRIEREQKRSEGDGFIRFQAWKLDSLHSHIIGQIINPENPQK
jgi:hypothetical protein